MTASATAPGRSRSVTVIGAGIVGISCALYLQRDGYAVTVIDPEEPGAGASKSNAGILSTGGCIPIGTPGIVRRVPKMLLDPLAPLAIRWRYLPWIAPWLLRFVRASRPERVEAISIALKSLLDGVSDSYDALLESAGAGDLVRKEGLLYVYRSDSAAAKTKWSLDLRRRRGIAFEVLHGREIEQLEPALGSRFAYAVYYPKTRHTIDPGGLVRALAADFVRRGGQVVRAAVTDVELGPKGPRALLTTAGKREVDLVVLAAGAWSRRLAARLGSRVPLDTERGYVVVLPKPGVMPRIPMISGDYDFAITPMAAGLRLSGTVELAGLQAPPNDARARKLIEGARRLFPEVNTEGAVHWMSFRPSMPDSLPVISRSPRYPTVFFAFGHGHGGMTHGPFTGKLIAELVSGRPTSIDLTPFSVERFRWVGSHGEPPSRAIAS